jgi:hypothetical protein
LPSFNVLAGGPGSLAERSAFVVFAMRQFAVLIGLVALFALALAAGIDFLCWGDWARWTRLHGKLERIGIQFDCWGVGAPSASAGRGQWVWTDDPTFLARVEAWLPTLRRPVCENALRQRGNRLVLVFRDGRQEEMLFLGPDRPGPSAARCGGFIWDGHGMVCAKEPFSEFLCSLPPGPALLDGAGSASKARGE